MNQAGRLEVAAQDGIPVGVWARMKKYFHIHETEQPTKVVPHYRLTTSQRLLHRYGRLKLGMGVVKYHNYIHKTREEAVPEQSYLESVRG